MMNPRAEWIIHNDENVRIVTDELWKRVQDRQQQRANTVGIRVKAGLSRKSAAAGRQARHLFSGWLTCSECGPRFTMVNRRAYACASYVNGRACLNGIHVRRDLVENQLLAGVRATLAQPELLNTMERHVRTILAERRKPKSNAARVATLEGQLDNLIDAVAAGGCSLPRA